ncbi:hypothetical protein EC957_000976 [Mortierella hygrophila]|uniref:RNA polymerase II assembly factor Rtp1 C-terminal domain-containing protein n=1 Tax=Mortierella hygrophila TaxID=979708 RepID=A0A9P6F6B9_9FUNG|nr:hypothetical protein EC957_000976 [Mortierella hygrophila]
MEPGMDSQQQRHNDTLNSENVVRHESQDANTKTDNKECAGELNVTEDGSKQAQSNLKAKEAALKSELRSIHTLVGRKLDIQNIDQELRQRLEDLAALRLHSHNDKGSEASKAKEASAVTATVTGDEKTIPDSDEKPAGEPVEDVRTEFVLQSVGLLAKLEEDLMALVRDREINDPANDQELLGLMDQRMIHTMLEIIVCWGIYPCLLPGVGTPLNRRVRSNIAQKDLFTAGPTANRTSADTSATVTDKPVDPTKSANTLWAIIEPLAKIAVAYSPKTCRFTTMGSILASRHIPDLYAALLQLAYRPLPKPVVPYTDSDVDTADMGVRRSDAPAKPSKVTPGSLLSKTTKASPADNSRTEENARPANQHSHSAIHGDSDPTRSLMLQQKEESAKLFHDLFWNTEASRSLESLTVLLSSASPTHPTPAWIKSVSGRFLSQILLRPGGVRVVLEYMQGAGDTVKLDQLERVAKLVTSVPDQMSSVHEYYRTICPELLEILEMDLKASGSLGLEQLKKLTMTRITPPNPQLVQTTNFVVSKLLSKNPAVGQVEIVAKEVEPLWKWGTRAHRKEEPEASDTVPRQGHVDGRGVTIEDADETGGDDVGVIGTASGLDPIVASEYDVVKAVMFLYTFLVGNEPSPPLFKAFLSQASLGLYQLYEFSSQVRSVLREKAKEILIVYMRILDPKETIEVLKSIVMRRRVPVSKLRPWQTLVNSSGQRIGDLVEMGSVGESYYAPGPTGGAVLRRRRLQDVNAATQLELDVDVFLDFLSEVETSTNEGEILGDLYMYLLDEYQSGKARGANAVSPRRMLTTLQLILSMTQKLGPSIMKKVTQIIGLANNILEHQGTVVSKDEDEKDESMDEDADEADVEILSLVLTLLSAILTENEHLSQQDKHLLALTLVHLKKLADHPLIEIRRIAHDLQTLIPTRLSDDSTLGADTHKKSEMEIEMEKYASALAALQDSLLPVRAHGLHILREMILAKSIVLTRATGGDGAERELDHALDIFVQHVQEPDSFIYLNAVKGLAALTDAHGPEILKKLMKIYSNENGRQTLETRLRVGEALVQTVQRCGEALGGYVDALLPGLYKVMNTEMDPRLVEARVEERRKLADKEKAKRASEALLSPEEKQHKWKVEQQNRRRQQQQKEGGGARGEGDNQDGSDKGQGHEEGEEEDDDELLVDEVSILRSSALTILATAAETCPAALLPEMRYLVDWVLSILDLDRQFEVRRAATLVLVLLFRALGANSLHRIDGDQLKRAYRTLRYIEQVDEDPLCRAQARAGIADLDGIVRTEMSPREGGSSQSGGLLGMISGVSGGSMVGGRSVGAPEIQYK